jgi:hypothetical protein
MNIREFARPLTSTVLNENLAARFGKKINLNKFTLEELQDVRNKLRTKLFQVETNESFNNVHDNNYQKTKLMLDVLNAAIGERSSVDDGSYIREGAEDAAALVMASKDMVDKITSWMEDTAEMQTESMLELADAIRDELGLEQSDAFVQTVKPALEAMYDVMETTRAALTQGVGLLTGEGRSLPDTMGAEPADAAAPADADMDADMEPTVAADDFAAAAPAAGGAEDAGRAKRESLERSRRVGQILAGSKKKS